MKPGAKPRVVHVTTVDLSLRYLLLNQLLSLRDAGYQITAISSPGPEVPFLESQGIHHVPVPMTRRFTPMADLISLLRLLHVMRRKRFDIVHTHTPKPGLLGQLAARLAKAPVVINTIHGFYFHEGMRPFWRRFYIAMERVAARCSHSILSQNREDMATAIREGICPATKIQHLGNGIDLERFNPHLLGGDDLSRKREEVGLPPHAPVVGFVGRLVREKGLPELIAAARKVLERVSETRFLFIGPADDRKADAFSPETVKGAGLADRCLFLGMRQDMPELYALMNVLALPSHREGFPRAPMEASAMGVPCVVTDIRGCREVVQHGLNGVLVPRGDVGGLAAAVTELLTDREKASRMGEEGRKMARERFDERAVFRKVASEYERLLHARGIPAL